MFNKGLDSSERQEGLLKRLKNIEDKTDDQLKAIGCQKTINQAQSLLDIQLRINYQKKKLKPLMIWLKKIKLSITKSLVKILVVMNMTLPCFFL